MAERLVDVEKRGSRLLHTFPVTTSAPQPKRSRTSRRPSRPQPTPTLFRMRSSKVWTPGSMPAAAAG
jgi:hypothetical protein